MSKNKTLVLKNYFLVDNPERSMESLQTFLSRQQLHGKESRYRTRFLKLIDERVREIEEERQKIFKEHAKKDKDGNILYVDKDGKKTDNKEEGVRYAFEDEDKVLDEYRKYLEEDYVIDVTPGNRDTIYGVRDLLTGTIAERETFDGFMATRYDEICESFENIN